MRFSFFALRHAHHDTARPGTQKGSILTITIGERTKGDSEKGFPLGKYSQSPAYMSENSSLGRYSMTLTGMASAQTARNAVIRSGDQILMDTSPKWHHLTGFSERFTILLLQRFLMRLLRPLSSTCESIQNAKRIESPFP